MYMYIYIYIQEEKQHVATIAQRIARGLGNLFLSLTLSLLPIYLYYRRRSSTWPQ